MKLFSAQKSEKPKHLNLEDVQTEIEGTYQRYQEKAELEAEAAIQGVLRHIQSGKAQINDDGEIIAGHDLGLSSNLARERVVALALEMGFESARWNYSVLLLSPKRHAAD